MREKHQMSGQEEMSAKTEELLDAMKGEMAKRKTKKLMIRSEQQNGADGRAGGWCLATP